MSQGKFPNHVPGANELIAQYGANVNPRMYKLVAFSSDSLGDFTAAKEAMTKFFSKADSNIIFPTDYEEFAKIYSKMPDSASRSMAFPWYEKAIAADTVDFDKQKFANEGLELAKQLKNKQAAASLSGIMYNSLKNPSNSDLYKYGMANYSAGNYPKADSIFCGTYKSKYPTEIYGYLWCAKSKQAEDDSLNSQGLAVHPYEDLAKFARSIPDSAKYKNQIVGAYFYLAGYYNDVKKDKLKAMYYMQQVLEVDPANESAKKVLDILSKPPKQPTSKQKGGPNASGK